MLVPLINCVKKVDTASVLFAVFDKCAPTFSVFTTITIIRNKGVVAQD